MANLFHRSLPARILFLLLLSAPPAAFANPEGGTVVGGSATISTVPGTVTINQSSNRAVINWNGFSVGAGELTRFNQPGSSSATLNIVTGGNPSAIYGTITAPGSVYLINQNGILVGAGAQIQTRSFIASTLGVDPSQFMAGGDLTFRGNSQAIVENFGHIEATDGDVVLIGRQVANHGTIEAPNGIAALAAGNAVLLTPAGDQRVHVLSGAGDGTGTGVDNRGVIRAAQAELKAAGGSVYALAVNVGGEVTALGVETRGGKVYLTSKGGNVNVTGTVTAKKSATEGGAIYAGGGAQGKDPAIDNAANLTVAQGATLAAGGEGDTGGTVVAWSDGTTLFDGKIETGAGGYAEVSGHDLASFTGLVNTRGGLLLIDPTDITVSSSSANTYLTQLASQDVVIQADNNIVWDSGSKTGSWTHKLTLQAGNDIEFVTGTSITNTNASGSDYFFTAGRDIIVDPGVTLLNLNGGGNITAIAGQSVTIGSQVNLRIQGAGGSLTLVAANNNDYADTGKITINSNASVPYNVFQADTIRLFAAQQANVVLTGVSTIMDSNSSTFPLGTPQQKAYGDAGTSSTGVYYSGKTNIQTVTLQQVETQVIQSTVIQDSNVVIIGSLGDLQNGGTITVTGGSFGSGTFKTALELSGASSHEIDAINALADGKDFTLKNISTSSITYVSYKYNSTNELIASAASKLVNDLNSDIEKLNQTILDIQTGKIVSSTNYAALFAWNFDGSNPTGAVVGDPQVAIANLRAQVSDAEAKLSQYQAVQQAASSKDLQSFCSTDDGKVALAKFINAAQAAGRLTSLE